jgi:hypothetical protein
MPILQHRKKEGVWIIQQQYISFQQGAESRELIVSLRCQVLVVRTIASSSIMDPLRKRKTPNDAPTYCENFSVCFLSLPGREHLRHKTEMHWTTALNDSGSLDYTGDIYNDSVSSITRS